MPQLLKCIDANVKGTVVVTLIISNSKKHVPSRCDCERSPFCTTRQRTTSNGKLKKLVFPSTKIQNRENTLLLLRLIPAFPSFSKAFTSRLIRKWVVDIQWYLAAQREYNLEYICLRYNSADKWKAFCALSIFLLRYLNIQSAYDWKEEL